MTNELTAHKATYRALAWRELGFMPIPCAPSTKQPLRKWKPYAHKLASPNKVTGLFMKLDQEAEIALIMGHQFEDGTYVLAVDYDDQESFEKAAQTWAHQTLIVRSKRGGHIYFKSQKPAQTTKTETGEIRGVNSYVMAPFSRHKDGGFYEPHPLSTDPHKNILHLLSAEEEKFLKITPFTGRRVCLPKTMMKVMNGILLESDSPDQSRSRQEYSVVIYLLSHYPGISLEEVKKLFDKLANEKTHYHNHTDKQGWITNAYYKAKDWLTKNHNSKFQQDLESLYRYANYLKWNWAGGRAERVVYLSFLDRAKKAGTLDNIHFSLGDICQEHGFSSKATASNIVSKLTERGLISKVRNNSWIKARVYAINRNPDIIIRSEKPKVKSYLALKFGYWKDRDCTLFSHTSMSLRVQSLTKDLILGVAGRSRALFFDKLSSEYQDLDKVFEEVGLSKFTFKKHLAWFVEHGLASLENGKIKLIEVGRDALDALARKLGVFGKFGLKVRYFIKCRYERLKNLAQRGRNKVQEELFNRVTGESLVYSVGL